MIASTARMATVTDADMIMLEPGDALSPPKGDRVISVIVASDGQKATTRISIRVRRSSRWRVVMSFGSVAYKREFVAERNTFDVRKVQDERQL